MRTCFREEKIKRQFSFSVDKELKMAKQDVEMKEAPKQKDTAETEEPQAEVSKEENNVSVKPDINIIFWLFISAEC